MTYRVRRKFTSHTFKVNDQLCKVFFEPWFEYSKGFWTWNVGFAIGNSNRQLNDWFWKRKNKRWRSLHHQLVGKNGMRSIRMGFEHVLKLRWTIPSGDAIVLDCTSKDPERQFHAWSRWHRYHPEWVIDHDEKKFYWFRPPYSDDPVRQLYQIAEKVPSDPLANTAEDRYFDCFDLLTKPSCNLQSKEQTDCQSPPVQSKNTGNGLLVPELPENPPLDSAVVP